MSSQPTQNTNQETAARGSYISIAASITSKIKCCITSDNTVETSNHSNTRNLGPSAYNTPHGVELDIPITVEEALKSAPEGSNL